VRVGVAIVLLPAIAAVFLYGAFLIGRGLWRRIAPWRLMEGPGIGGWALFAARPGQLSRQIGPTLDMSAEDFDSQLFEARAQARVKLRAMNDERRWLS
jgi:hypothetical protein